MKKCNLCLLITAPLIEGEPARSHNYTFIMNTPSCTCTISCKGKRYREKQQLSCENQPQVCITSPNVSPITKTTITYAMIDDENGHNTCISILASKATPLDEHFTSIYWDMGHITCHFDHSPVFIECITKIGKYGQKYHQIEKLFYCKLQIKMKAIIRNHFLEMFYYFLPTVIQTTRFSKSEHFAVQ